MFKNSHKCYYKLETYWIFHHSETLCWINFWKWNRWIEGQIYMVNFGKYCQIACPPIGDESKKLWNSHTWEYYTASKKDEEAFHKLMWMPFVTCKWVTKQVINWCHSIHHFLGFTYVYFLTYARHYSVRLHKVLNQLTSGRETEGLWGQRGKKNLLFFIVWSFALSEFVACE